MKRDYLSPSIRKLASALDQAFGVSACPADGFQATGACSNTGNNASGACNPDGGYARQGCNFGYKASSSLGNFAAPCEKGVYPM
jgi:hypothetical protein